MTNHPNRSITAKTQKIATAILGALRGSGVEISSQQEATALAVLTKKPRAITQIDVDLNLVQSAIDELGYDAGVAAKGKKSMIISFWCGEDSDRWSDRSLSVICAGEKYCITFSEHGRPDVKWCMPRSEVAGDRADKFLVEVLHESESEGLKNALSVCLGIDPRASIGYTKEILAQRRKASM